MNSTPDPDFSRIAKYLLKNRDSILANWRSAVAGDPKVSAAASLARTQFIDHIPRILDAFDHALRARDRVDEKIAEAEQRAGAADHGEHRWLHGYNSRETMREWGHLHICMLQELEAFALGGALVDPSAVSIARTMLAQLFVDCMVESAGSHAALERAEAESRLAELERVLQQLRSVDRARIELWREAAHDLRGTVGAVKLAATALGHAVSTPELPGMVNLVRRGADSLDILLSDLIELTRLEAGRERRDVADFSVVDLIRDLGESLQPLAAQRRLFLKVETPSALVVQGDAVKVRRIAQNLILNALKYTAQGGVVVSCTASRVGDVQRWSLCVQDTGVGFDGSPATPLAQAISEATQEAHTIAQETAQREPDLPSLPPNAPTLRSESAQTPRAGEGIGLSIVKRLCELLDASIELESHRGRGTTFRITFPTQYST